MASAADQVPLAVSEDAPATGGPKVTLLGYVTPKPIGSHLEYIISQTPTCILKPFSFFISWQGVLTLAYRGFPPALLALKQNIADLYGSLPKENPGSKWPKTTIGAVKDGKRLTPQQFHTLREICRDLSGVFQNPQSPKSQAVKVDNLAVVLYECRSLERQLLKHVISLSTHTDNSEPSEEEKSRVDDVLAESDHPDYWYLVSRDGNREPHYRATALGATLVHELACFSDPTASNGFSGALPGILRRLKERVDLELPGLYSWLNESSLHITIRALMP